MPATASKLGTRPHGSVIADIKHLLSDRRSIQYWIAEAPNEYLPIAIERNAWAVRRTARNAGMWRGLSPGNVVFLKNERADIVAYGIVESTEQRRVDGLEQFPFWIDFQPNMVSGVLCSVRQHIHEQWYRQSIAGGLSPLPDEFGAELKLIADEQSNEGKMWVEPNPYLLRGTTFDVAPGQVFVVQAWNLKDSVFPVIKEVLANEGYSALYAGDRDGQVIFEDIWLMLNESEAVIVDFTFKRPNVYLEYGMALVLGKPIVAITQNPEDIPSDTPNLKYLVYKDALGDRALAEQLTRALRDTMTDIHRVKRGTPTP